MKIGRNAFWRGLSAAVVSVGLFMVTAQGWADDEGFEEAPIQQASAPVTAQSEHKQTLTCGGEATVITNNRSTAMKGRVKLLVTAVEGYEVVGTATSSGPGGRMDVLCRRSSSDRPQEGECAIEVPAASKLILACDGPESGCGENGNQVLCIFHTTLED